MSKFWVLRRRTSRVNKTSPKAWGFNARNIPAAAMDMAKGFLHLNRLPLGFVHPGGFQPKTMAVFWHPKTPNLTPKSLQICTGFSKSGTSREQLKFWDRFPPSGPFGSSSSNWNRPCRAANVSRLAQFEHPCHQMPRLPHKVSINVTKCHACHTKCRGQQYVTKLCVCVRKLCVRAVCDTSATPKEWCVCVTSGAKLLPAFRPCCEEGL